MPKHIETIIKDGKRITTRFVPLPIAWILARIAKDHAFPLIEQGPVKANERNIQDLLKNGAVSVVFLAMTVEAAANQVGEDAFGREFDDFEHCRGRFKKGLLPKGTPAAVQKWAFLFQEKGGEKEFLDKVAPGLAELFDARHRLTHYKVSQHAEKWVAEGPTSPDCIAIFTAYDKYKRTDRSILASFQSGAIRNFY